MAMWYKAPATPPVTALAFSTTLAAFGTAAAAALTAGAWWALKCCLWLYWRGLLELRLARHALEALFRVDLDRDS